MMSLAIIERNASRLQSKHKLQGGLLMIFYRLMSLV